MDLIKDNVNKLFYQFLLPSVSSAVAVAAYSLIDTIAIGHGVGANGVAACALVLPIFSIAGFIALLCGIGGSVLMNRSRGEGDHRKGDAYFTAAILLAVILTFAAWAAGNLWQDRFYQMCGADDILLPYARAYGEWIFAFLPSFAATTFLACFVRSDGSPRFVLFAVLTGGVINIIGDWLFVFPLQMEMAGAAIATVLGSVVQASMLLGYVLARKTSLRTARPRGIATAFQQIFFTGFGAGIGSLAVIAVSFIANNQIMSYAGGTALAVYGVLGTVSALFTSIYSGIGQAAQPIASTNYGAKQYDRCLLAGNLGMRSALIFGTLFAAVSIAFPLELTSIFMEITPETERTAPYILYVYSLSYIPLSVNVFSAYYLQSMKKPQLASAVSLLRGIFLVGIFLLVFPLIWGDRGIWWAIFVAEAATAVIAVVCLSLLSRKYRTLY